jgi:hypothetical protein
VVKSKGLDGVICELNLLALCPCETGIQYDIPHGDAMKIKGYSASKILSKLKVKEVIIIVNNV